MLKKLFSSGSTETKDVVSETETDKQDRRIGFTRKEMYSKDIFASIKPYEKHIFFGVGTGTGTTWPEKFESRGIGRLLDDIRDSVAKQHRHDKVKEPKLKISATDDVLGRVLIFPEQVAYQLEDYTPLLEGGTRTRFEDQLSLIYRAHLLQDKAAKEEIANGTMVKAESLADCPHVFACVHQARDKRCGYTGPILIDAIKAEIAKRGSGKKLPVLGISHVGGHKFAGNVIVFSPRSKSITPKSSKDSSQNDSKDNSVIGDWYGYVTPKDVPSIVDSGFNHTVIPRIWRGAMGVHLEYNDPDKDKEVDKQVVDSGAQCDNCDCEPKK